MLLRISKDNYNIKCLAFAVNLADIYMLINVNHINIHIEKRIIK